MANTNSLQKYFRIYEYIDEFWNSIYDVYSRHAIAYLCNYYSIDVSNTVWDSTNMMSGPYEWVGELSGVRWRKILLLPVFFITETSTDFDGKEEGVVNEGDFTMVIPSSYGFIPIFGDIIKLDQAAITYPGRYDNFPVYIVTGIKKQSSQDKTYFHLHCDVYQSKTVDSIDAQTSDTVTFFDYDKKIHTLENSITMTQMLEKSNMIRTVLKQMYDQNSGYYLV